MAQLEFKRESTVKDFLEVVFRRKWVIIGIVLVAVLIVITFNLRGPAIYESFARVLVKRGEATGVFVNYVRTLTWEEEISSQIEMAKSQVVVERAREILSKYLPAGYESSDWIDPERVSSGVVATSNVIWVSYISPDPIFCESVVNALVNSYREYYQEIRTPPEMEDFFSQEMSALKEEIEYWRERKELVEVEWGIIDIKQQRKNALDRLSRYQLDLEEVVQERSEIKAYLKRLETLKTLPIEEQSAALSGLSISNLRETTIEDLHHRLVDLKMEESGLASRFTEDNKYLIKVRKQIVDLNGLIEGEINSQILINKSQLEILGVREETIRELEGQFQAEMEEYPRKEVEIERINVALERLQSNYNDLVEQHINAKISLASNPEWTVTILNPASKAYQRKTRDYVRMALGPIFSLIIALGVAFFIDNLDHSLKNVSEAEESLGMPVLTSFPEADKK